MFFGLLWAASLYYYHSRFKARHNMIYIHKMNESIRFLQLPAGPWVIVSKLLKGKAYHIALTAGPIICFCSETAHSQVSMRKTGVQMRAST